MEEEKDSPHCGFALAVVVDLNPLVCFRASSLCRPSPCSPAIPRDPPRVVRSSHAERHRRPGGVEGPPEPGLRPSSLPPRHEIQRSGEGRWVGDRSGCSRGGWGRPNEEDGLECCVMREKWEEIIDKEKIRR
jgi:hypothetical protein